jgi:hypothetical protein
MEIKVHVNGAVRIVHGLNRETTVQEVVKVLARSLNRQGRYFLIEMKKLQYPTNSRTRSRNKNSIRLMSSDERPLDLLEKYSTYSELNSSFEIQFYLLTVDDSFNERAVDCGEDIFIYLLNSLNLKRAALETQLSHLINGNEGDMLSEMFESQLQAQHSEIEKRKKLIEKLESENQLLNCHLYRIVGKETVDLDLSSFIAYSDDAASSTASSSSEAMSDSSICTYNKVLSEEKSNNKRRSERFEADFSDRVFFF